MKLAVAPYQSAAWCVRITCVNGTVVRLTSYPTDLTMSNATVYKTDSGYQQTAFASSSSFSPSSIDIEGVVSVSGISRDALASGVFDNARVLVFKCDFLNPVEDYEPVAAGFLGKTTLEDDRYTIQGMSLIDALNQSTGKMYTAACSRTFGDAGCTKNLADIDVVGAVSIVTSSSVIRDTSRSEAADWFAAGTIQFTSGLNAGLKPLEIKSYAADGTITTFDPFFYLPQVGDTFVMIPGCRKRLEDCRDKWNNVINFFGFSNMPTSSSYQQVAGNR
jgi:uncharacterized phage protein (TIGR02218 family)